MKSKNFISYTGETIWHIKDLQVIRFRNGKLGSVRVSNLNHAWIDNIDFDIYKNNKLKHPINHDLDIVEIYDCVPVGLFGARLELLFKIIDN